MDAAYEQQLASTLHWATEVEKDLVSLCWHHPEICERVLLHLDPDKHFSERLSRDLLLAINMVYRELGETNWPTVVECMKQSGWITDKEQLALCSEVYALAEGHEVSKDLINYYIEILSDYALLRYAKAGASLPILRFRDGFGSLKKNKLKAYRSSAPDFSGELIVAGVRYELSGWLETDIMGAEFVSLKLSRKRSV